jgi:nitrite reductase (NADH) small subunit
MNKYWVARTDEIPEGGKKIVKVREMEFGIFHVDGQFYAWRNVCPHAGAPVCLGRVCGTRLPSLVYEYNYGRDNEILRCPWHGWEFDLKTGEHLVDPDTRLRGGKLEVEYGEREHEGPENGERENGVRENEGQEHVGRENLEPGKLEADGEHIYLLI